MNIHKNVRLMPPARLPLMERIEGAAGGKKRIDRCLELLLSEVARHRSVSRRGPSTTLYPFSPSPSARSCAASRALHSLLEKIWRTPLAQGKAAIACMLIAQVH
jgi:hypothetical protein